MRRRWLGLVVLLSVLQPVASDALESLGSARLEIQGQRATILPDDVDQTISVGEPARVRTCFAGVCGTAAAGDPAVQGLRVRAELTGPELPDPVPMCAAPGGTFLLPGFQAEGDYRLENIRLVNEITSQVLGPAEPSVVLLHVRRILLASATVERLTLEQLQARGVTITQESYQAFNFAVGFAFGSETVVIDFPVLFEGSGSVSPLDEPTVHLDGLPEDVAHTVSRWQPPQIVPFHLEVPPEQVLEVGEEIDEVLEFPLFGAIVIPGNVAFLNQFFSARLIVANGADAGSDAVLDHVTGTLRLPRGNVLRLAETDPPVAPGQPLPVLRGDLGQFLEPGDQGTASWTVEGLVAGTHVLSMDVEAELQRPGRDPFPLRSRAQAAVEVVDARFHLTFAHPDVVREGEPYTLFATVTNMSRARQDEVTITITDQHLVGAHKADADDDFVRRLGSLEPGQSRTAEFALVADFTGQVVASTFETDADGATGTISLYAGVGELGIPLSPATLILPRFSDRLAPPYPYAPDDELLRANVRLLGLAHSLAVAPAGLAPDGLPHVISSDVTRRAVDLAEAGQRLFLGEELLESLEVLLLDQLGSRHPLAEMDELRRWTDKGLAAASELGRWIRQEQENRDLGAEALLDHFAETTSYSGPYLAAMLLPGAVHSPPVLEIRRTLRTGAVGTLARTADEVDALRSLPFGEVYAVSRTAGGTETVPLAVVGHIESGPDEPEQVFHVLLRNTGDAEAQGRLLILAPAADGGFRKVDLRDVTLAAHQVVGVDVSVGAEGFDMYDAADGESLGRVAPAVGDVPLRPFEVVGAVQDFLMGGGGTDALGNWNRPNRYGHGVSYLFSRPPNETSAESAAAFSLRSSFTAPDTSGGEVTGEALNVAQAAWLQPSGRVVNVRYTNPVSALVRHDETGPGGEPLPLVTHVQETLDVVAADGSSLATPLPNVQIETEPRHTGGLVEGGVVRGSGVGAAGAKVQLIRPRRVDRLSGAETVLDLVAETVTGGDGRFVFDFVEEPSQDPAVERQFILRATVPPGDDPASEPAQVEEVSSFIRHMNRVTHLNIALLGRGRITGRLLHQGDDSPVQGGTVVVASTLFNEIGSTQVAADGSFAFDGVPVGPLTLTGRDPDGRAVYATVGLERPGDSVDVTLRIQDQDQPPGVGEVVGVVLRRESGVDGPPPGPVSGARVAVYSDGVAIAERETTASGGFRFTGVPAGQVTLQAADWRVSQISVVQDLVLAADETAEVELVLASAESRTVVGSVVYVDPFASGDGRVPVAGATVLIPGAGVHDVTAVDGSYRLENVPVQAGGVSYHVTAIDTGRGLQGDELVTVSLDSPDEVVAPQIELREMRGSIRGVVLDPLGNPFSGAKVVVARTTPFTPYREVTSGGDGSFVADDLPLGDYLLTAHVGDGLQPGFVGYFGEGGTSIVFGGHQAFASVRMVGGGVANVCTRTDGGSPVSVPVYYKPTYYSETERRIRIRGSYTETATQPTGCLAEDGLLDLPVGRFEVVAHDPFHGTRTVTPEIRYAGHAVNVHIVFPSSATVEGRVVGADGVTPVPGIEVTLHTSTLLPQIQLTDPQGGFRYELVPPGGVKVTVDGTVDGVRRVGVASGNALQGQTLDLEVRLKAQGTVRGRVTTRLNGVEEPLPHAQVYVAENSHPYRRLPSPQGWYTTDGEGRFEVSQVFAGGVTVVARDPAHLEQRGSRRGVITTDWEVVDIGDVVISRAVGTISVTVRDPDTGGPLPDSQVRLNTGETTVADADGRAVFDALSLGSYSVYVFHAPTGRSGRTGGLVLAEPGSSVNATVYVDQRGEVRGTLYDGDRAVPATWTGVPGATVELKGGTAGGSLTALDTTSGDAGSEGAFDFPGIPEGHFTLTAGLFGTPRRASTSVDVTESRPVVDVNMFLESIGDVWVRLYEHQSSGDAPVDPAGGVFSVRVQQTAYDFTRLQPEDGAGAFLFPGVLTDRGATLSVSELGGEGRGASAYLPDPDAGCAPLQGAGTSTDPCRLVLGARGVVRVTVQHDVGGSWEPSVGAEVRLRSGSSSFAAVADANGRALFSAVPAGNLTATATSPLADAGSGIARGSLTYDDDQVELTIHLSSLVSATGVVYQPVPGDRYTGDPSTLVPQEGALVGITDAGGSTQYAYTGSDGGFRFDGLAIGEAEVNAATAGGLATVTHSTGLVGPAGTVNTIADAARGIPGLLLDGAPPSIVSIVPAPGAEEVSRDAEVIVTFSESLLPDVLPTGEASSPYFRLRAASGSDPVGVWSAGFDGEGRQFVRFDPWDDYHSETVYSVSITAGPAGVRDRNGRPLAGSSTVGSSFRTADTAGPKVVATEPVLDRPVVAGDAIRLDFNEVIRPSDGALDDEVVLLFASDACPETPGWCPLPSAPYLTRNGYSVSVTPDEGVTVETLPRRLEVSCADAPSAGLEDTDHNRMDCWSAEYRVRDDDPPVIDDIPHPAALTPGTAYTLIPTLSGIDHYPGDPAQGDLDRVEYFLDDPESPASPAQPAFSATVPPYGYDFVAVYDAASPTLEVWARAVDTSTNSSDVHHLSIPVAPNQAPVIAAVTPVAVTPVAGVFYAGSTVRTEISGLADPDGPSIVLGAEMWTAAGARLASSAGRVVTRPGTGDWADLPTPSVDFELPIDQPEGSTLLVRVRATDSQGARTEVESAVFEVADDQVLPEITDVVARGADGVPGSLFHVGDSLRIELRVRDIETAVRAVSVTVDHPEFFGGTVDATLVPGSGGLYRTGWLEVLAEQFSDETPVEVLIDSEDWGGNAAERSFSFSVAPRPDETAPTVEWLSPWEGGLWPAGHVSTVAPGEGVAMLLRVRTVDTDEVGGEIVPGSVNSVRFRGPVSDGAGGLVPGGDWIDAVLVDGTAAPGSGDYQAVVRVPDLVSDGAEVPFEVHVVDDGNQSVSSTVRLRARTPRLVWEGASATVIDTQEVPVAAGGDADGPVFLLDGTTLRLYPPAGGSLRSLGGVVLWSGGEIDGSGALSSVRGSTLTVPAVSDHDSAVTYYPLELEVAEVLAVGAASRIDVSGRGLLGGDGGYGPVVLGDDSPAGRHAGGSHGGAGWFGSPDGGWSRLALQPAGSAYDSIRDPGLPGGGGGAATGLVGGQGGGVVRIAAPTAEVRVEGEIRADGSDGDAFMSRGSGAGAGGAVAIVAGRLGGRGTISASGGDALIPESAGGGGGGRVAVVYGELVSGFDVETQLVANGGGNGGSRLAGPGTVYVESLDPVTGARSGVGKLSVRGDAGLVPALTPLPAVSTTAVLGVDPLGFVVSVDADAVRGTVDGDVLVVEDATGTETALLPIVSQQVAVDAAAPSGRRADLVVDADQAMLFELQSALLNGHERVAHGRSRFSSVAARGAVRLVADGDLEIAAAGAEPVLNDRAALDLGPEARVLLRGEGPRVVSLETDPPAGAEVRVGSAVSVTWSVSDPLALERVVESWPIADTTGAHGYFAHEFEATNAPDGSTFVVPPTAAPGEASFGLLVRDRAGRESTAGLIWTVLSNSPPVGVVTLAAGAPADVQAGLSIQVVVHAEDVEGLASVELVAAEPAIETSQIVSTSGTALDLPFTVSIDPTAGAGTVDLHAVVTDTSGATFTTGTLTLTVVPDETAPVITIALDPVSEGDSYLPSDDVTISVDADDEAAVASLAVTFDGETTTSDGGPIQITWTAPSVRETTTFIVEATAADPAGNLATASRTVTVERAPTVNAPSVSIDCPLNLDPVAAGVPISIEFHAAEDDMIEHDGTTMEDLVSSYQLVVDGAVVGNPVTSVNERSLNASMSWTPPADALPGDTFDVRIEVFDLDGNSDYAWVDLVVIGGTVLREDQMPYLDDSLTGQDVVVAPGEFIVVEPLQLASLTLLQGATVLNRVQDGVGLPLDLHLTGSLFVGCGATMSVSGRGYPERTTRDGESVASNGGGSHLGRGGGASGSTYGSVYQPREAGAGSSSGSAGGGVIVVSAQSLRCDGEIRADGDGAGGRGGAGGSVWVWLSEGLEGAGRISADGGATSAHASYGGGGGSVAVHYGVEPASWPDVSVAGGGATDANGGAGTIYLLDTGAGGNGELVVDNRGLDGQATILPSLGGGTAAAGTGGSALVVDPTELRWGSVPEYFGAHWIEVFRKVGEDSYEPSGLWRIGSISQDGLTVTLEGNIEYGEPSVQPEDIWRGVYRFDSVHVRGQAKLRSADPILVPTVTVGDGGELDLSHELQLDELTLGGGDTESTIWSPVDVSGAVTVRGPVAAQEIHAASLVVASEGTLSHPSSTSGISLSLELDVSGDIVIEAGGAIDVSGRGYPERSTLEGETISSKGGGSHAGRGGGSSGNTYGSVYFPMESGAGSSYGGPGGGVIRISAQSVVCEGEIRADGESGGYESGGGGGSVWLTVTDGVTGAGIISANGGASSRSFSGGGGAIAIHDSGTAAVEPALSAAGGDGDLAWRGGAGTILLRSSGEEHGRLVVDNGGVADGTYAATELPSLGIGEAADGSGGARLVVNPAELRWGTVPEYFGAHWIEVLRKVGEDSYEPGGVWRIGSISQDGLTLTLEGNAEYGEPSVQPGDLWRGVYRFDSVHVRGQAKLRSADPILVPTVTVEDGGELDLSHELQLDELTLGGGDTESTILSPVGVSGAVTVQGPVAAVEIRAASLVVESGGTLSHPSSTSEVSRSLELDVSGDVVIEAGGAIDVSGRGYPEKTTYGGETAAGTNGAGAHLGEGAGQSGTTFGSVYLPMENGGGSNGSASGGGVVTMTARTLICDGAIHADGEGTGYSSGAGGSIWIRLSDGIQGSGRISADGGNVFSYNSRGGGGGAVAIYWRVEPDSWPDVSAAGGGATGANGGSGTIYLLDTVAGGYGDLLVDNAGLNGQATVLPSLGSGAVVVDSLAGEILTDRETIQPYFVGHWVEVRDGAGVLKGTWRILDIDDPQDASATITLQPSYEGEAISVSTTDTWRGVYWFDSVTVQGGAVLVSDDPVMTPEATVKARRVEPVPEGVELVPGVAPSLERAEPTELTGTFSPRN